MQAKTPLLSILLGLLLPVTASAQQKLPIGVVDMRKIDESMDTTELKAEQAKEEEPIQREVDQLVREGKKLVADSETLTQGSFEHSKLVGQIEAIQENIKILRQQVLPMHKEIAAARYFERRHALITKRIQELAEQKGLLIVLRIRSVPENLSDERKRFMVTNERDVLYHHASLDLTDELIKLLKVPDAKNPNDQKPPSDQKQPQAAPAADSKK